MFIRKKRNSSGKICVQVIDKSRGKYRVLYTAGSSVDPATVEKFENDARKWMLQQKRTPEIDFSQERAVFERFAQSITHMELAGIRLLLGGIFDDIGFGTIADPIFRYLVFYRIAYPRSKLKTTEFLSRYHQINWNEDKIYRYLDKLYKTQKEQVQAISFQHTLKIFQGSIKLVFYDVTTLYFEIEREDDLRKTGFSKDGKAQHPQIVLGLLVSEQGYPLAYEIFEGNKYEGHTMLPVMEGFKKTYQLEKLVVVADAGLLSVSNMEELNEQGYEFILGARLKKEEKQIQDEILSWKFKNGESRLLLKGDLRLVISYSESRASKDAHNREKGLQKLNKLLKEEKLTKAHINNRGYNKFLVLEGDTKVTLDAQKVEEDKRWDGLKGYLTNSQLDKDQVIENYKQLWQIEKAFRITKDEMKIRPIYHRLPRRIEAHICITFAAYKIYKELERQLTLKEAQISAEKAIEIALSIFEIHIETPRSKERFSKLLLISEEQRYLAELFGF